MQCSVFVGGVCAVFVGGVSAVFIGSVCAVCSVVVGCHLEEDIKAPREQTPLLTASKAFNALQ